MWQFFSTGASSSRQWAQSFCHSCSQCSSQCLRRLSCGQLVSPRSVVVAQPLKMVSVSQVCLLCNLGLGWHPWTWGPFDLYLSSLACAGAWQFRRGLCLRHALFSPLGCTLCWLCSCTLSMSWSAGCPSSESRSCCPSMSSWVWLHLRQMRSLPFVRRSILPRVRGFGAFQISCSCRPWMCD